MVKFNQFTINIPGIVRFKVSIRDVRVPDLFRMNFIPYNLYINFVQDV